MLRVFFELHVDVMNCRFGVMDVEPTLSRLAPAKSRRYAKKGTGWLGLCLNQSGTSDYRWPCFAARFAAHSALSVLYCAC
jgi:hypothetical protein